MSETQPRNPIALTARQEKALPVVVAHASFRDAAQEAGVSERTLYRWMAQGPFRERVLEERQAASRATLKRLPKLASRAIDALDTAMTNEELPLDQRVEAARGALALVADLFGAKR